MKRAVALAVCLVAGCRWGTITPDEFKQAYGMDPSSTAQRDVDVFAAPGLEQCLGALRTAVGETDIHATELELQPTFVEVTARSPKDRGDVDTYTCRYGKVGPSAPVRDPGSGGSLDRETFSFSSIDLAKLPVLIAQAPAASKLAGATVSHVMIETESGAPKVRVYVRNARNDMMLTYDGHGLPLDRARDVALPPPTPTPATLPLELTFPHVAFADLATASLGTKYEILDGSQPADATRPFDAVAQLPWARRVAAAWKSDAELVFLGVSNMEKDGTVLLAPAHWVPGRGWVTYAFRSRSCAAMAGSGSSSAACVLIILVDSVDPSPTARVRIGLNGESFAGAVGTIRCRLPQLLAPLEHEFPYAQMQGAELRVVGARPVWTIHTWSMQGKDFTYDAVTCKPRG